MGNHQFGFANRPSTPEFLGKGWNFVKEKRRGNKEKKTKSVPVLAPGPAPLRRPNSTTSFLKVRYSQVLEDGPTEDQDDGESSAAMNAGNGTGTPKEVKRKSSVKRSRSMRCSPTVPDSVTLTLGVVTNVVIGASNVAAKAAGSVNVDAVVTALDALQKLTPAAPQLGKEPSFDEFFEEAERRNQTMEVLQAALIKPSSSNSSMVTQNQSAFASSGEPVSPTKEGISPGELRNTVSPPTPPPSRKRSPVPSLTGLGSRSRQSCTQIGSTDEEDGALSPTKDRDTPLSNRNRVLIIVGGCEQESLDEDRWDRCPPTIIVHPENGTESLFPPSGVSSSSSSSCLTTIGTPVSCGTPTPRPDRRRGSASPTALSSTSGGPLGVRFADEIFSPPSPEKPPETVQVKLREPDAARRAKRRSSIRRKTIGGITSLTCSTEASSAQEGRTVDDTATPITSSPPPNQQRQSTRALSKKSFSKSELAQSPPIISLLKAPQINLIRQLWQQLYATKGPTVLGNHIFQRVVFKNSQVREVFRTVDIGNQCWNVDIMCKSHAKSVAVVLDDVVRNLDNLEAVDVRLIEIGRQHAVFHDLGFHTNYWSVFAEAFIDCTLEWGEKNRRVEEARKAWAIIIAHISDKMKLGYQEARRSNLPRIPSGRRIRMSETEQSTVLTLPIARSDSQ